MKDEQRKEIVERAEEFFIAFEKVKQLDMINVAQDYEARKQQIIYSALADAELLEARKRLRDAQKPK